MTKRRKKRTRKRKRGMIKEEGEQLEKEKGRPATRKRRMTRMREGGTDGREIDGAGRRVGKR